MVRLGEMNCGKISEVAANIGRQLLAGESLSRTPGYNSVASGENIVTELLGRESLSVYSRENSAVVNQSESTSESESLEIEISQEVRELYEQGVDCYYAGDLEGAIAAFKTALEIDLKFYKAWNGLGNTLSGLGRYSDAIAAFETALEIDLKFYKAWNGLGNTLSGLAATVTRSQPSRQP